MSLTHPEREDLRALRAEDVSEGHARGIAGVIFGSQRWTMRPLVARGDQRRRTAPRPKPKDPNKPTRERRRIMLAQLWRSFQEGGWAMYFIFALGFLGVGAGGRFAWRGEHQLLPFLRWLAITLIACGAFGFLIDWQRALQAALGDLTRFAPPDLPSLEQRLFILIEGTKEALNCLSAALLFVVLVCLLGAIGQRRFPLPNPGALAR